ncbi:hypothetical protein BKA62DRAFT_764168 [Auriculariales sp. MPI-PUGE-AT-0066]|nr:hypothetical protein BKA62DRAFT_764168 [Auriculariales sp. MPI-PUGE-AT-0066]
MANAASSSTAARKKSVVSAQGMLQIDIPQAAVSALNKSASQATSLYQQCSQLRDRLRRVYDFPPYLDVARARGSTDPVTHLWDCLALGVPLCFLFNLLHGPQRIDINTDPHDIDLEDNKARQRATALFVTNVIQLQKQGEFAADGDDVGFQIRDLITEDRNTTGFAKVVRTVTVLVDRLPPHVFRDDIPPTPPSAIENSPPSGAGRLRADSIMSPPTVPDDVSRSISNVCNEILATERKYVSELEIMQGFANEIAQRNILDRDTLHRMFPNLPALFDFQQRFLISMEQVAEQPWPQHWGKLFTDNEEGFTVYEPYCAHYTTAADILFSENSTLTGISTSVIQSNELPAFLIKPVQRVCRYPLLLAELIKKVQATDYPLLNELTAGLESVKRIADKMNEAKRIIENRQTMKALESRVEDWKGHHITNLGDLLLDDVFTVTKSDVDREYHVFLFEKIILCCKEAVASDRGNRKSAKSGSLLKKPNGPGTPGSGGPDAARKRGTPLLLKGRIFLNNVTGAKPQFVNGVWLLHVHWKGDDDQEHFTLRCSTQDQLKMWESQVNKLIQDIQAKRAADRAERASTGRPQNSTNPAMPPMHPLMPMHGMNGASTSSAAAMHAQNGGGGYPSRYRSGTTDSEMNPPPTNSYYGSEMNGAPTNSYYGRNSSLNGFDEDDIDTEMGYNSSYSGSGRGTPVSRRVATQSMPPERDHLHGGYARDRARTEDASGALMREWSRVPAPTAPAPTSALPPTPGHRPGMPRGASTMSGNSNDSFGPGVGRPQLRSQFSSNRMRGQYENGAELQRYPSQASTTSSTSTASPAGTPPLGRSRSASQPSHPSFNSKSQEAPPPLPNGAGTWSRGHNGVDGSFDARNGKRGSGSSGAGSSDYSPPQTMSPVTPYGSHDPGHPHLRQQRSQVFTGPGSAANSRSGTPASGFALSPPIKVKVHYGEDLFVISIPRSTEYDDLIDKVGKKIRLCGPRRDDMPLRVKYRDEDGDLVSLASNEDVQLAFEASHVTLYVQ